MSYLNTDQVAAQLGVTPGRVRALCRQHRIPGARLNGRVWFVPLQYKIVPGKRGPKPRR